MRPDMLKLLSCAQGHYWEKPIEDGAAEATTLCPVCGQSGETMPLLDLAPSEIEKAEKTPITSPPSPPPLRDKDGKPVVAGYEILSEIGKAPTGVRLYRARQVLVNRPVTLKVVFAKEDPGQLAWGSLRSEATALGRLAHPNIVPILEAGERERQLFFNAIEHVDGPTLAEVLSGKPLPFRQALALVETLARAVHHAHEKNILHRNLKPASVRLQKAEAGLDSSVRLHNAYFIPKITDFGLARRPMEGDSGDVALQGDLPRYLAPEQAWGRAKEIGPATDVYALGAILYQLIGGWPPFRETTVAEMLDAIQTRQPPPLSRFRSRVPRAVEAICRKCLAKQPRRRYASALALAEDLRRSANGYPVQALTSGALGRVGKLLRRNAGGIALLLLGFVLAGTLFALLPSVGPSPEQLSQLRDLDHLRRIQRLEADQQRRIALLESEMNQTRNNENYLLNLLLAQRALESGDKEKALKILERCPGRNLEWDYLNSKARGRNQFADFHTDLPILCMALNDQFLVAGGGEEKAGDFRAANKGEVSIWNLQTRKLLWHWEVDFPVRSVALTDNLLAFVSSSQRRGRFGSLHVRFLRNPDPNWLGELVFPPYQFRNCKPTSVITRVITSLDLLVVTDDGRLHQVDAHTGKVMYKREVLFRHLRPPGLNARVRQVDTDLFALINPEGNQVVLMPELHSHNPSIELPGGQGTIFTDLDFDHQHKMLAAAAADGVIRMWNVAFSEHEPMVFRGHQGRVNGVSFSKDGQRLASCGQDGTVRIWDVKQGIELLILPGYPSVSRVILDSPPSWPPGFGNRVNGRLAIAHGNKITVLLHPSP